MLSVLTQTVSMLTHWVRSPAGDFCGQTSQLHAERDSLWNRILKTGFLRNCFVLSRLWQAATEDDHCCGELVCYGRAKEMRVCSVSWMDFLLCVWLPSLPIHPFGERLAGVEQPGRRWRITVCWSSFSFPIKTPREAEGKVMWDQKQ